VADVRKLGDRWRAELKSVSGSLPIAGLAGAAIDPARLSEGASVEVTGIVRRPYPTATDRRLAVLPRSRADVRVLALAGGSGATGGGVAGSGSGGSGPSGGGAGAVGTADGGATGTSEGAAGGAPEIDLGALADHRGTLVRVGGVIVEPTADGALVDDGTAVARLVLRGPALDRLADLRSGDAIAAVGRVEAAPDGDRVVVDDPAGIVLAGIGATGTGDGGASPSPPPNRSDEPDDAVIGAPTATGIPGGGAGLGPAADEAPSGAAGATGIGVLAALALAVGGVAVGARRLLERRRLAARIAARLAAFGPAAGASTSEAS
jgi:hypothetical protein